MKTKRVDLSKLSPDQRAALAQLSKDARSWGAAPEFQELQQTARRVFDEWLKAPQWGMADGHIPSGRPGDEPPASKPAVEDLWHTGAPEVNYVEELERPTRP